MCVLCRDVVTVGAFVLCYVFVVVVCCVRLLCGVLLCCVCVG